MRWVAGRVQLPLLRRTIAGLALSVGAETAIPVVLSAHGSVWHRLTVPHPSLLPLIVAAFTGPVLGALTRPRWLGVPEDACVR